MIISAKRILELNNRHNFIENLSERELNPEGVGFDLRVGEVYEILGEGVLGVEERKSPDVKLIASALGDKVLMEPGKYVLVKTMERVNIPVEKISVEEGRAPTHIMADVRPRSTLQRSGIYFMGTKSDPGYVGELTFALANVSKVDFKLEIGARLANLIFCEVIGDLAREYGGQWKGGRVSTGGTEKQI